MTRAIRVGVPARALGVLLLVCSALVGCGAAGQHAKEVLRLPLYSAFRTPDPALASLPSDLFVTSLLYSGLVKFGPDLHVIPELAVSLPTISSGGRVYTFTIRNDARFADGQPVVAHDMAYSLTRAIRLGGALARRYLSGIAGAARLASGVARSLTGITVVDRLTIRIRLWQPDADFLQKLSFPVASVVDRRVAGMSPLHSWTPAGTGPWVVTRQATDSALTLAPRPHFYGSAIHLQSLVLMPVRSESEALSLYHKNALDVARVPQANAKLMSNHADFHESDTLGAYYALPHGGPANSLASALDRDSLVGGVDALLQPLSTVVPPAVPDYVSSPPSLEGDGTASSTDVALSLSGSGDRTTRALARSLARQWRATVVGDHSPAQPQAQGDITIVHAWNLLPDPGVWLRLVLPQTKSQWFRSSLTHANLLTNDPVTRMDIYDQTERWAIENGLIIPLASDTLAYLIKPSVQSLQVTPVGIMPENNNWATVEVT